MLDELLAAARNDGNVLGVVLKGSRALGTADEDSDWDLVVVVAEGEPRHEKSGALDVLTTTLSRVRDAPSWELPALAHASVLLDKTGEVTEAIEAAGRVSREELAELYDSYLNDFYRSLKSWRRGRELAARIEAARSLWWLGEFLIALDGRRAPYPGAWSGRLGELEPLILDVARGSDPAKQQELQATVERVATAHGFRHVYDAWNGEIDRVMTFRFDEVEE